MISKFLYGLQLIGSSLIGLLLLYVFLKTLLGPTKDKRLIFKIMAVFALVTVSFYFLITSFGKEPDFFKQAVEQLHSNTVVAKKIGAFSSYTFNNDSLPKDPKKFATFKIELTGDSLTIYLRCTMKKNQAKWDLVNVVQDTIVKNPTSN